MTRLAALLFLGLLTACREGPADEPPRERGTTGGRCEYESTQTLCPLVDLEELENGDTVTLKARYAAPARFPAAPGADASLPHPYEVVELRRQASKAAVDAMRHQLRAPAPCEVHRIRSGTCTPVTLRLLNP